MTKKYKSPPFLQKGDKVGICSMASAVSADAIRIATEMLQKKGFEVVVDPQILAKEFNFAGNDEIRRDAIQKMLDDQGIKAIFSSRGGYGVSKNIDQLDFTQFLENPKWIIGFSDITALHMKIQSLGFQSIHGPMPSTFGYSEDSFIFLINSLKGESETIHAEANKFNKIGKAQGPLIGGNLCLLAHNIGSAGDFSLDAHLLFIEDIGEYAYNIDRMMVQLKRAGKLKNLAGLIIGDFSDVKENDSPFGKCVEEIILDHVKEYQYPVAFGFPIGHEKKNLSLRNGASYLLTCEQSNSKLKINEIV